MEFSVTIEQVRAVHQARPFRPFLIHTADGRSLFVPSSESLSHSPNGRTIIVFHHGETFSVLDLLGVNRLEVVGPARLP